MLCDRICLMDQGQVIALDTPAALVQSLQSESAIEFRLTGENQLPEERSSAMMRELGEIQGVTKVDLRKDTFVLYTDQLQTALTGLIRHSSEAGLRLSDLQTRTATLEDVFIQMTGRSLRES